MFPTQAACSARLLIVSLKARTIAASTAMIETLINSSRIVKPPEILFLPSGIKSERFKINGLTSEKMSAPENLKVFKISYWAATATIVYDIWAPNTVAATTLVSAGSIGSAAGSERTKIHF